MQAFLKTDVGEIELTLVSVLFDIENYPYFIQAIEKGKDFATDGWFEIKQEQMHLVRFKGALKVRKWNL